MCRVQNCKFSLQNCAQFAKKKNNNKKLCALCKTVTVSSVRHHLMTNISRHVSFSLCLLQVFCCCFVFVEKRECLVNIYVSYWHYSTFGTLWIAFLWKIQVPWTSRSYLFMHASVFLFIYICVFLTKSIRMQIQNVIMETYHWVH